MSKNISNLGTISGKPGVVTIRHDRSSYKWRVLTVAMVGTFMVILDSNIVNVAMPKIMAVFGISIGTAEWILNGYLLKFFRSFNYTMSIVVFFIFGLSVFGSIFLLPFYLQNSLGYTAYQAGIVYLPLGIIMGIVGPISGILIDKINLKIVAVIGIALLGWSCYSSAFLSLFSIPVQIMLPIYLCGFGTAFAFTSLSAIALTNIWKWDMAQASGRFNVIRQVGGSFGVAIIGAVLTQRTLFYTSIDGQNARQYSPVYQHIFYGLKEFATMVLGAPGAMEIARVKASMISDVVRQAIVQATDSKFLFAFAIMILCIIPILFPETTAKGKAESLTTME